MNNIGIGKVYLIVLLSLLFNFSDVKAQDLSIKIDSVLNEKFQPDGPGAAFLVSENGKIVYEKAFGYANLELGQKMTSDHVFQIGSITKQFTAIAILMLEEQGKLKLDDELTKFIPDYPVNGQRITIHHLLNHTSGIKSYTNLRKIYSIDKNDMTPKELVDFFKNEPMNFSPGEAYKYNNSGYVLLGYIIEQISGVSYEEFIENEIFKHLGMNNSYYANRREIIKKRASGYHKKETFQNARYISHTLSYSAGALMSTVDDLNLWQQALLSGKVISRESLAKAFTNYPLNDGDLSNYGYGWNIKTIKNTPSYEHGGFIFGFKSMGVYLPEYGIYVIGLSNCDCNSPTKIVRQIAEMYLKDLESGS